MSMIARQAHATTELKEAAYALVALGFTFKDIAEIISDTADEHFEAREFDEDPDLQTDR
jgi:Holliday junction resolvasome RuvABC DNA-binding subunit